MSPPKPQITFWDKASLVLVPFKIIFSIAYGSIRAFITGDLGGRTFYKRTVLLALRAVIAHTTTAQKQYLIPSDETTYLQFAKKEGFTPAAVTLPDGTKAFWTGSPKHHPLHARYVCAGVPRRTGGEGFERNQRKDVLDSAALHAWAAAYLGDFDRRDNYNEPIRAPADWWRGSRAEEVYVGVGGNEVFAEAVVTLGGRIKERNPRTKVVVSKGEAHCEAIMNFELGLEEKGKQFQAMQAWFLSRF